MTPAPERERRPGGNGTALENENLSNEKNSPAAAVDQGLSIKAALIAKNQRETLRLSIDDYKGYRLLSARLWFQPRDGDDLRPGRDGWAIALDKLPDIIGELQRLEAEARSAGLLT